MFLRHSLTLEDGLELRAILPPQSPEYRIAVMHHHGLSFMCDCASSCHLFVCGDWSRALSCEITHVGDGNPTWVLWESGKHSYLLNLLSSPKDFCLFFLNFFFCVCVLWRARITAECVAVRRLVMEPVHSDFYVVPRD